MPNRTPLPPEAVTPAALTPRRFNLRRRAEWRALEAYLTHQMAMGRVPGFIDKDPLQFPHRYRRAPRAAELVGFLAALLSYGARPQILKTVADLLERLGPDPWTTVADWHPRRDRGRLTGFYYRFHTEADVAMLLAGLSAVYGEWGSLEALWQSVNPDPDPGAPLTASLGRWVAALHRWMPPETHGQRHWLPDPAGGGACKRLMLFLRWMVRTDDDLPPEARVDLGLWRATLSPAVLHVPLDVHVARQARLLGLTDRKANDWKTVEAITDVFRRLDPADPVRFDFALFSPGITD